ncbi:MAG TPA: IS4 family transposase [Gemmatimonadaceae bacterium]|nr:IS4 family transposase [Gemmatimonadaceae bacterium]
MRLSSAIQTTAFSVPSEFDALRKHIDPQWVEEALAATGFASLRRRRLPADQVVWLVLGMALMRNESIGRVATMLKLAMPSGTATTTLAPSALVQARQRLSDEPLEYLFALASRTWADRGAREFAWKGLALYGIDGTTIRVPDTPENWAAFGGQAGNGVRAGSAYPTVRMVALMALRSHVLAAARFGPYASGEVTLAAGLWDALPDDSLVVMDRNFTAARDLHRIATGGRNRHWLIRVKTALKLKRVARVGEKDFLVELKVTPAMRKLAPGLPDTIQMREIRYRKPGFQESRLITSLLDPKKHAAAELVGLYHERWELELGFDEIKTHQLAREEAIRSRTPTGVRQELWGIALAYNLIRIEMERAAAEVGVEPTRISFVSALSLIRTKWVVWSMAPLSPGRIPEHLLDMRQELGHLLLPERRTERRYPRVVKLKMSNYDKKWVRRPRAN